MITRKYTEQDKNDLAALWKAVFPDDPPHNEPVKVIEEKLKIDDLILIAETEGKIIGACMVGYDGHRGWLYAVGVLHEFRRIGAGKALVSSAVKALEKRGCIKLNLQIRASNYEVTQFYKSLGFSIEERISMSMFIG